MKLILGVIISLSLLSSCGPKDKGDIVENVSVNLNNNKPIRLYQYGKYIELTGVFCDFFQDYENNKESYAVLMKKLNKKNWKFDYIGLECGSCWNDSMDAAFLKLNRDVFGTKLISVTFEEEKFITIKLDNAPD